MRLVWLAWCSLHAAAREPWKGGAGTPGRRSTVTRTPRLTLGAEAATPEASVLEGSTVAEGSTLEASSETADGGDSGSDTTSNATSNDGASDSGAGPDAALACSPFVTNVINVTYGAGAGFGQSAFPAVVKGPPRGGGTIGGSLHVLTLGNGGSIVVELGETIVDGPGPDFIVFENPFNIGSDPLTPFAEVATVEVSADGVTWSAFPCTATAYRGARAPVGTPSSLATTTRSIRSTLR